MEAGCDKNVHKLKEEIVNNKIYINKEEKKGLCSLHTVSFLQCKYHKPHTFGIDEVKDSSLQGTTLVLAFKPGCIAIGVWQFLLHNS